jgi:hypothetical protein
LVRDVLPDTGQEFALRMVGRLTAQLAHPGVFVEINGRPLWEGAGRRLPEDKSANFTRPFGPDQSPKRTVRYADLFATAFRRLKAGGMGWPNGIDDESWLLVNKPLVDGLNAARWTQYLRDQGQTGELAPLAYAFLNSGEFKAGPNVDGGKKISWPLLQTGTTSPVTREQLPFIKPSIQPGYRLIVLGDGPTSNPDEAVKKAREFFEDGTPGDWKTTWLSATDADQAGRRLAFMGAGRLARILEATAARDLQVINARTRPTLGATVAAAGGEPAPEVVDFLRKIVHERLRLAAAPPVAVGAPWQTLVETAPIGGKQYPIALVAPGPTPSVSGRPPGKLLLVLADPWYEASLHAARDTGLNAWVDDAATTVFQQTTLEGTTDRVPATDPQRFGFRVATPGPGSGVSATTFRLTAHELTPDEPLRLLQSKASASLPINVRIAVSAWPELGLKRKPIPLKLSAAPSPEVAAVFKRFQDTKAKLLELGMTDGNDTLEVQLPVRGLVFAMSPKTIQALMKKCGVNEDAPPFPQDLPPLLEFRIEKANDKPYDVAAFAPIPPQFLKTRQQDMYFLDSLNYAPPAVQLVDLLLELFARRPEFRSAPLPDVAFDRPLPRQLRARLPAGSAWAGKPLRVEVKGSGGQIQSRRIVLAGPAEEDGGTARPVPLIPSEAAQVEPTPQSLALDTLAVGTMPEHSRQRLDSPAQEAEPWSAAARGVLVYPLTETARPVLEDFTTEWIRMRTESVGMRGWYLVALCLLIVATLSRVVARALPSH